MNFKQGFTYTFTVIFFYLGVFFLEILVLYPIIEGINIFVLTKTIIMLVLVLVINPIITFLIVSKLPFKPKNLLTNGTYQDEIRKRLKEVENEGKDL